MDIIPDDPSQNTMPRQSFKSTDFGIDTAGGSCDIAIEICTGSAIIRMSNSIDSQLFRMVLSQPGDLK